MTCFPPLLPHPTNLHYNVALDLQILKWTLNLLSIMVPDWNPQYAEKSWSLCHLICVGELMRKNKWYNFCHPSFKKESQQRGGKKCIEVRLQIFVKKCNPRLCNSLPLKPKGCLGDHRKWCSSQQFSSSASHMLLTFEEKIDHLKSFGKNGKSWRQNRSTSFPDYSRYIT